MAQHAPMTEMAIEMDETLPMLQEASRDWPQTRAEYESLIERYQGPLVRYAFRKLGHIQDAEDVVQDVFVRGYVQVAEGAHVSHVLAYLYRMTANACTDVLRRRRRARLWTRQAEIEPKANGGSSVADEALQQEAIQKIERMVARLTRRQAEVVRLRVWDGLRFEEIAEVLGCPIPTVKSRFRYALVKLRSVINTREEAL